jgi:hypothetical protein
MIATVTAMVFISTAHAEDAQSVIDVHASGGVVVPMEQSGSVPVGAISIGTWVQEDLAVRLRLLSSTPPVPADGQVSDAWTWGMMIEMQKTWGVTPRLDPFWTVSAGFVASDRKADASPNLAALAVHGGIGFAARLKPSEGPKSWTISPVLGVAPRLLSEDQLVAFVGPTAEVRLGYAW